MGNSPGHAYTCDLGNGTIPTKIIDDNNLVKVDILTQPLSDINNMNNLTKDTCIAASSQYNGFNTPVISCNLSNPYAPNAPIFPLNPNITQQSYCQAAFNKLGLQKFNELGFINDPNVNNCLGKQDGNSYTCASYDGQNCIQNVTDDTYIYKPLNNITCKTPNQEINNSSILCEKAFDYWNLYPSTNPLVIRGRNINQELTNNIVDPITLNNLANTYSKQIPDSNSSTGINSGLNQILSETPLKLGCCSRIPSNNSSQIANVKVPLSPTISQESPTLKSFNFQKENLVIPATTCPANLHVNSDDCNAFYGVYCLSLIHISEPTRPY